MKVSYMVSKVQPIPKPKLLFLISEDWYFISHRLSLGVAALQEGYEVVLATTVHHGQAEIEATGIRVIPLQFFNRTRIGIFSELRCLLEIFNIYRTERPDIVHQVTIKPALYGSIMAVITKIPFVVNAIAGLGHVFTQTSFKNKLLGKMIAFFFRLCAVRKNCRMIVQNEFDQAFIIKNFSIPAPQVTLIRGAGIDLNKFAYVPEAPIDAQNPPRVVFLARMLQDKGVHIVLEAIQILKKTNIPAHFIFCGAPDPKNPRSVSVQALKAWHEEGLIEWQGHVKNVAEIYQKSHLAILPSYYGEGTPKSLLEAAACGRAIITTDVPGCSHVIQPGVTGLLIPPRDSLALVEALQNLLNHHELRKKMGQEGRRLMGERFSLESVIHETLAVYQTRFRRKSSDEASSGP